MELFQHQVGGHPNTIKLIENTNDNNNNNNNNNNNGSTIIKPSTKKELNFYNFLGPNLIKQQNFIGLWTPMFYGTLTLNGKLNELGELEKLDLNQSKELNLIQQQQQDEIEEEEEEEKKEMLVLENLTHRFLRPNILDIKLGTQLFDEDATTIKKTRMLKVAEETTSLTTGMRLTGFQVWDSNTQTYPKTPKTYGKSLSPSALPIGIRKFFLLPSPSTSTPSSLPSSDPKPLPLTLLRQTLLGILSQVIQLRGVLENLEWRLRGGSLLVIFEGDGNALEDALKREREEKEKLLLSKGNIETERATKAKEDEKDSTLEEQEEEEEEESDTSSISTSDSNGTALPHTLISLDIRLIDFAHVRSAIGEGPDVGILKGLDSFRDLLEDLINEVEERLKL